MCAVIETRFVPESAERLASPHVDSKSSQSRSDRHSSGTAARISSRYVTLVITSVTYRGG
jgi:hypothetical protein